MSLVTGEYGGERAMAAEAPRERETSAAVLRERAGDMYTMKLFGRSSEYIGKKFKVTARHVNREIRGLPKYVKDALERDHRRGQKSLAGLHPAR